MQRLTFSKGNGEFGLEEGISYNLAIHKLMRYENTGLTPEQIIEMDNLYYEKCKELGKLKKEGAKEFGMDLRAPLKPEDHVFIIFQNYSTNEKYPFECIVKEIKYWSWYPKDRRWQIVLNIGSSHYEETDIGKKIFLTKEDAEKAIKRMKTEEK